MKRLLLFLTTVFLITGNIFAQATGLSINEMFGGKYVSDPNVSQTILSGENRFLRKFDLTTFATFRGPADSYAKIVAPLVLKDGTKAESRNVRYNEGKLAYAFFALRPATNNGKDYRYIYYINPVGKKKKDIMLIYFDGPIDAAEASKLIPTIANSSNN